MRFYYTWASQIMEKCLAAFNASIKKYSYRSVLVEYSPINSNNDLSEALRKYWLNVDMILETLRLRP